MTTRRLSTSPAYSSCGGPGGGPAWVPRVTATWADSPGRAQTARARRSRALSSTRSPRAGQVVKSVRPVACHAVAAAVVNLPGSRAAWAAGFRAYGGAAALSGPHPCPGSPRSAPHTTTAAVAASAAFRCWRRRIRSVGRACREQGSYSGEDSSGYCRADTESASFSAAAGLPTPASSRSVRITGSGSFSRPRRT